MRGFADYNPIAVTVYFAAVTGIAMFSMNPIILSFSLFGSLILFFIENGLKNVKTHLYTFGLFTVMSLINPFVSHNGVTVLFVMNDNPITLEALVYGIAAGTMIVSVLYWFGIYSAIMTSDKLLHIFGALSPKLALILSMALRYIPLFGEQVKKVSRTQKALGLYKDDNIIDNFKGRIRVFSVMVTWALENGIVTADSMTARGYGSGKRSRFTEFAFKRKDILLIISSLILSVFSIVGLIRSEFTYYPAIKMPTLSAESIIEFFSYGILILLPAVIEAKEALKWKYLRSKI